MENSVEKGLAFLQHPRSKHNSLASKVKFLGERGLSASEINEVIIQASDSGILKESTAHITQFTVGNLLPWAAILAVGALTFYLSGGDEEFPDEENTVTMESNHGFLKSEGVSVKQRDDRSATIGTINKKIEDLEFTVQTLSSTIKASEINPPEWARELLRVVALTREDVNALVSRDNHSHNSNSRGEEEEEVSHDKPKAGQPMPEVLSLEQRLGIVREAVSTLAPRCLISSSPSLVSVERAAAEEEAAHIKFDEESSTPETDKSASSSSDGDGVDIKAGGRSSISTEYSAVDTESAEDSFLSPHEIASVCTGLLLYIKKVKEFPSTPRYHRIVESNVSFQKSVLLRQAHEATAQPQPHRHESLLLPHVAAVLSAVGFVHDDARRVWEWAWASSLAAEKADTVAKAAFHLAPATPTPAEVVKLSSSSLPFSTLPVTGPDHTTSSNNSNDYELKAAVNTAAKAAGPDNAVGQVGPPAAAIASAKPNATEVVSILDESIRLLERAKDVYSCS